MKLTVDGYVYQWQRRGGVSRIFSEILPRMCDQDTALRVRLLTEARPLAQTPPTHRNISSRRIPVVENYLRPKRIWRKVTPRIQQGLRAMCIGGGKESIWHSTYFTEPNRWRGKRVVTVFDLLYHRFPELFNQPHDEELRRRMSSCTRNADRIIAISNATSRDIQEHFGINDVSKIRVVHLACGDSFQPLARKDPSKLEPKPFLLYVGDRNHYKNFQLLLRAFARWPARDGIDLVVAGGKDWSSEEVASIRDLHLIEDVRRIEPVDDKKLVQLYNDALAFVYPSLYEGFGIPLLEALSCGCPVVASSIPSTVEVAGDCPIYFDPANLDSLLGALDEVVAGAGNEVRRAKGIAHARQYSWDKTAQQTLAIYKQLEEEMSKA